MLFKGLRTITKVGAVAAISLIGTGYAAWTFSGGATAEQSIATAGLSGSSGSGGGTVSDIEYEGTLEIKSDAFYLMLDQAFVGFTSTATATSADVSKISLAYNGSDADGLDESIDFVATGEVVLDGAILDYISIGDNAYFTGNTDSYEFTYSGAEVTFDYYLPTVSWVDGMKPKNAAELTALQTAVSESTITVKFDVSEAE